jgi:hypothetical protein
MIAHGFGMYGMWGPITDPGERGFTERVAALGVNIHGSPYRDYEVNTIVDEIKFYVPKDAIILIWGSSLGANNAPLVASYAKTRTIHGIFGFQASLDGAQILVPSNVGFAHEFFNPYWLSTLGLGAYEWNRADGNHVTKIVTTPQTSFHPGETTEAQDVFLAEMKTIMNGEVP